MLLFWLRTKFLLTNRRLVVEAPNVILGIIPAGSQVTTFPINQIASVGVGTAPNKAALVIGVILLFGIFGGDLSGLISLLIGIVILVTAFSGAFRISNTAGEKISFGVRDKDQAKIFANQVTQVVMERRD